MNPPDSAYGQGLRDRESSIPDRNPFLAGSVAHGLYQTGYYDSHPHPAMSQGEADARDNVYGIPFYEQGSQEQKFYMYGFYKARSRPPIGDGPVVSVEFYVDPSREPSLRISSLPPMSLAEADRFVGKLTSLIKKAREHAGT